MPALMKTGTVRGPPGSGSPTFEVVSAAGRVLVVDDHVALAENIAEILEGAGYATAVAETAEQALQRIARGDICLLITDYRLPDANGIELISEIVRSVGAIPAIVVSGFMDDDMVEAARNAGACAVLAKPVVLDRLMMLVRSHGPRSPDRTSP